MIWLVPRNHLTQYQERAVELKPDKHRIVMGSPGSGKTLVLLYRACYLRDKYLVPQDRFKIFVFTGVLKTYIKSAFEQLELPQDCVTTLYKWCSDYHRANRLGPLPGFLEIHNTVLQHIKTNLSKFPIFDFVLVDEGQDLDGPAFEIMKLIARHVTVCIDHKQQIYEQGSSAGEIAKRLGVVSKNLYLLDAFRCCPYIAKVAAQFISDDEEKEQYLNQVKTDQGDRQTPLLYYVHNHIDERRRLIEIIKTRQQKGDSIGILFHQNRHVYGYAKGLQDAGIPVEVPNARYGNDYVAVDFNSDNPKILTFHGAKGLTFDTILMPQLTTRNFYQLNDEQIERLLFVGITRATKWVYMSCKESSQLPCLKKLHALEAERCFTIQRPDPSVTGQPFLPGFGPPEPAQVIINDVEDDDLTGIL